MVDVMDGVKSPLFAEYRRLCGACFKVARNHANAILLLVDIMQHKSVFPAFDYNKNACKYMKKRFKLKLKYDEEIEKHVNGLIKSALNHRGTAAYDVFQKYSNKISI
jgi:phosphatidylinositol kinase/protein kinase (PI-3  family)